MTKYNYDLPLPHKLVGKRLADVTAADVAAVQQEFPEGVRISYCGFGTFYRCDDENRVTAVDEHTCSGYRPDTGIELIGPYADPEQVACSMSQTAEINADPKTWS